MTANYEKPQPGNPHQLTIKQHCLPRRSIERFANDKGLVNIRLIGPGKTLWLKPDDKNFCALRTWNQKAESGFMREVEDAYQSLADKIVNGSIVRRFKPHETQVITDMYVLWQCRWHWNKNTIDDQRMTGSSALKVLGVTQEYSKDDQEVLEKEGVTVIRPDLSIAARDLVGPNIYRNFRHAREQMSECRWGILTSRHSDFIVPDNASRSAFLPVTPNICLDATPGYRYASEHMVRLVNQRSKQTSDKYYFGRLL